MKLKLQLGLAAVMCALVMAPAANAQSRWEQDRRQDTKNEWRNIAIASGLVSVLGLLKEDSTLTFAGAAGALYSAYRYEQDRKSQNRLNRARYTYFSQPYFYRDGKRYDRQTVNRNGQQYYQFVCRDNDRDSNWGYNNSQWNDRNDRWDNDRNDHRGCARHSSFNSRCDDCRDHDRRNDRRNDDRWDDRRNNSNGNWNNGRGSDKWNNKHKSALGGKSKGKNGRRN